MLASGTLLLSTLLVMFFALIGFRVVNLVVQRRRLESESDPGRVETEMRAQWRLGAGLIAVSSILVMLLIVVVSGVNLLSPLMGAIEVGIIWAILGMGLTLTYAVVKIPNFAHGDIATLGAYAMALTYTVWRFPLPLAFLAGAVAGALMGLLQHRLVFLPLLNRGARLAQIMIGSFALSLILRSIYWILGAYYNITQYGTASSQVLYKFVLPFTQTVLYDCGSTLQPPRPCSIAGYTITDLFIALIATIIPLVIGLHLLLTRTLIGKSMRAVADNIELAQITGINVELVRIVTWVITGALTGVGGAFLALELPPVTPELGWTNLLPVFAAITLGGLVSFYGTIAGGLIVGFGQQWVPIVGANFGLTGPYGTFMVFTIIVIVLLVRPTGLQGLNFQYLINGLERAFGFLRARLSQTKPEQPKIPAQQ